MRKVVFLISIVAAIVVASVMVWSKQNKKEVVAITPEQVKWFVPEGMQLW